MIRLLRRALAPASDYLGDQVRRSADKERRILAAIGIGGAITDIGCGPGQFTALLANWYPDSPIAAIEPDPTMRALAIERFRVIGERLSLIAGSAACTGVADTSQDTVLARLVYQHLADPAAALQEAWRVLRPGGRIAITDVDDRLFGIVDPEPPALRTVLDRCKSAQTARGGDRHIAGKLPRLLHDAGFVDVDVEVLAMHGPALGDPSLVPQLDDAPLDWLMRDGRINPVEQAACAADRKRLLDAYAILMLFVVHARKPGG